MLSIGQRLVRSAGWAVAGDAFGLYGVSLASLASVGACVPFWLSGVRSQTGLGAGALARMCAGALLPGVLAAVVFGVLASLLPRDAPGLLVFALAGTGLTYAGLRACERLTGLVLLPSLQRLKAL